MKLHVNLQENSYDIFMERGILHHIGEHFNLQRKVLIIRDENVPYPYYEMIASQCLNAYEFVMKSGEDSKCFGVYEEILRYLMKLHFTRKDCVIALGGGVCGDLSGFVASSYMRGIPFIQVPTTTLSQIDSSIGGKVAINVDEVKNVVGAFYQPKAVFIDLNVLESLPKRHFYNGLVEALKAGLIYDPELFTLFEEKDIESHLEEIIYRALCVKKDVVEQDEKEQHLRKILNFGHTIGHGIESYYHLSDYYHGECVAMGMLYFMNNDLRERTLKIYDKLHLNLTDDYDCSKVFAIMKNDKKASRSSISIIEVNQLGKAEIKEYSFDELWEVLNR